MELTLQDPAWREAVEAIDRGDVAAIERLIEAHPGLAYERAEVGEGYFARPYLMWFVAENPVRTRRVAGNVVEVARVLVEAARRAVPADGVRLAQQLDGALALVASGCVVREQGVQRPLIDVFAAAGGDLAGAMAAALPHRELDAAMQLLACGARETLAVAASLGHVARIPALAPKASAVERAAAMMCAAVNGQPGAIRALVAHGADPSAFGPPGYHAHATPLHEAVAVESLAAVEALLAAGADATIRDRAHGATPLGWAEHLGHAAIADRLRGAT